MKKIGAFLLAAESFYAPQVGTQSPPRSYIAGFETAGRKYFGGGSNDR